MGMGMGMVGGMGAGWMAGRAADYYGNDEGKDEYRDVVQGEEVESERDSDHGASPTSDDGAVRGEEEEEERYVRSGGMSPPSRRSDTGIEADFGEMRMRSGGDDWAGEAEGEVEGEDREETGSRITQTTQTTRNTRTTRAVRASRVALLTRPPVRTRQRCPGRLVSQRKM